MSAREAGTAKRHGPDWVLLTIVIMLLVIGLIAVYSASYALGYAAHDDSDYYIKRQLMWAALGCAGMLAASVIDYRWLRRISPLLMLLALVGLCAALVPGIGVSAFEDGPRRWIEIGPFSGQPSEIAKLAVIVYLSAWLAAKGPTVRDFQLGVVPFVAMVGLVTALVLLEPDLGTALLIAAITGTLFFVSGARLTHLVALAVTAVGFTAAFVVAGGYGMTRILSFTSAETDPEGFGFQTLQMLIALGSGGWTGLGLGVSRQKFFFVPAAHTDGILSIIGEELGFVGVTVVLLLFVLLLWRGLRIMQRAADPFGSFLVAGILMWIALQVLINVGGVTRSIPLTGITLPFLSYGGSSLAVTLTAIGILLSVSRYAALDDPAGEPPSRGVVREERKGRRRRAAATSR
ncbi:MAG: putative lipid II flippase FtsW [Chloroflexi bacterium]|nr:putative lipid II flippase FtsW [Chloroflexota bacterium]MYE32349.1 putative lipid II flippase FtsW [Chloroflexota bacterium]